MGRKFWKNSRLTAEFQGEHIHDIASWLLQFLPQQKTEIDGALVAVLPWVIWNARNKWLFEGEKENSIRLEASAESVVESFRKVRQPEMSTYAASRGVGKQKQWCPSPNGWRKVNVDAAVDVEKQVVGLGVVVRNFDRSCIAGRWCC